MMYVYAKQASWGVLQLNTSFVAANWIKHACKGGLITNLYNLTLLSIEPSRT